MTAVAILPPFDQQKILIVITETITLNYVKNPPRLLWISEDPMSDQSIAHSTHPAAGHPAAGHTDRKSVVSGKSVSVRVDLGGRRIIKQNKMENHNARIRDFSNNNYTPSTGLVRYQL